MGNSKSSTVAPIYEDHEEVVNSLVKFENGNYYEMSNIMEVDQISRKDLLRFEFLKFKSTKKNYSSYVNNRLVITQKIKSAQNQLCISTKEVKQFWSIFKTFNVSKTGYLSLEEFYQIIHETKTSVITPFLEQLYCLMDRKDPEGTIPFDEFFAITCSFSLYTYEELVAFVFIMLDFDKDNNILKKDIYHLLSLREQNEDIFPPHVIRAVELFEVERADQITREDFNRMIIEIPYLIYPVWRLQDSFKNNIMGYTFWSNLEYRIKDEEAKCINTNIGKIKIQINEVKTKRDEDLLKKAKKTKDKASEQKKFLTSYTAFQFKEETKKE